VDRDDAAGRDHVRGGRLADLGRAEQLLELPDPGLLLALFLSGGVVAAVLPEVPLFTPGVDLCGDDRPSGDQLVELRLQPVVGLLGQPGGRVVDTDDLLGYS